MVKVIYRNFVLAGSCVSWISTTVDFDSRSLRFVHFNILKNSFFHLVAPVIPSCPPLESGCEGKACFSFSKLFKLFFQTFFPSPRLTSFPRALSLESGCKDKRRNSLFPNFFNNIFKVFYNRLDCNTLKIPWPAILEGMYTGCPGKQPTKDQPPAKQKRSPTSMPRSWFVHDSSMVATIQQERLDKRQGSLITNA